MKISPGDAGSCSTRLATIKHNHTAALKEPRSTVTCWTAYGVHYNMLHISQSLCLNQWNICSCRSTSQLSSLCSHSQQTCHNAPSPGPVLPCFGEITVYQYGNKYSHFKNTQRLWCGAHKDSQTSTCPWPATNTSLICQTIFQEIEGSCKMLFSDETHQHSQRQSTRSWCIMQSQSIVHLLLPLLCCHDNVVTQCHHLQRKKWEVCRWAFTITEVY